MTDKELLELAAKAAGFIGAVTEYQNGFVEMSLTNHFNPHGSNIWNPLTDDGDALRLAVELMKFEPYISRGVLPFFTTDAQVTRRAITRAAAEIGRSL